jgi:hypothetical protein
MPGHLYKACENKKNRGLIHTLFNAQERRSNYLAFAPPIHKLTVYDRAIIVPGYKITQSLILYLMFSIG